MKIPSLLCILLLTFGAAFDSLWAHGSMAKPISRSYQVFLENPQTPRSDAARAAIAVAGTQAFYDWHEVNRQMPNHDYRAQIPDGQLAGAGRAKYAGLDLARTDWPATRVSPGHFTCVFYAPTPHEPSYFEAYITKAGYDPRQPLKWSDLEPLPGAEGVRLEGNNYIFDVHFPERQGRHVLYVIWQRIDPVGEVFFSTSDLDFGGVNYGTPSPEPMTAPDVPAGGGHQHPTPTPTPNPNPTPNPTPTPVPGNGHCCADFENDQVIVRLLNTASAMIGVPDSRQTSPSKTKPIKTSGIGIWPFAMTAPLPRFGMRGSCPLREACSAGMRPPSFGTKTSPHAARSPSDSWVHQAT